MEASVSGLWRYPASSLAGESLEAMSLGNDGVEGDRRFGVIDAATGDIARPGSSDSRWNEIAHIAARFSPDGQLEIATPASDWLPAPGAAADEAASAFLGFAARIVPLEGEAGPGHSGPLGVARYHKAPVHLLTTASLARLRALHPGGTVDPRRFRPNIVIDLPEIDGRFPESEWTGRRLAIGDVELAVVEPCRRCGFTIQSQQGFDRDPEILRQLVRHNGHNLGIYCSVERAGTLKIGDQLRLADRI